MMPKLRPLALAALLIMVGLGTSHALAADDNAVFGVPGAKWGMKPADINRLYEGAKKTGAKTNYEVFTKQFRAKSLREQSKWLGYSVYNLRNAFDGLPGTLLFYFDKTDRLIRIYYGATLLRYPIETDLGLKEFQALVSTYDKKLHVDPASPGMDKDYEAAYKSWIWGASRIELAAGQNPPGDVHVTLTRGDGR